MNTRTVRPTVLLCAVVIAVAAVAVGVALVVGGDGRQPGDQGAAPGRGAEAPEPDYLPPNYRQSYAGPADGSGHPAPAGAVRVFEDPAPDAAARSIPLLVRLIEPGASIPGEDVAIGTTVRGRPAELIGTERGGLALSWHEGGAHYAVAFEPPADVIVDFAPTQTRDELHRIAEGLRITG